MSNNSDPHQMNGKLKANGETMVQSLVRKKSDLFLREVNIKCGIRRQIHLIMLATNTQTFLKFVGHVFSLFYRTAVVATILFVTYNVFLVI